MIIHPTARLVRLRCPYCGNDRFPVRDSTAIVTCPALGCERQFDPNRMPNIVLIPPDSHQPPVRDAADA